MSSPLETSFKAYPPAQEVAVLVEQAVLGTLFAFPGAIAKVRDTLRPEDFAEGVHQGLYGAMCEAADAGQPVTPEGITARLGNPTISPGATLRQYIGRLNFEGASPVASLLGNVKAVMDAARMRRLEDIRTMLDAGLSAGGIIDPSPLAAEIIAQCDAIMATDLSITAKPETLKQASRSALQEFLRAADGVGEATVPYGITSLDRMTGGMAPGELIVMAGRPGMGKTAVALTVGLKAAEQGIGVFMGSFEMGATELGKRLISAAAYRLDKHHPIPYADMTGERARRTTPEQRRAAERGQAHLDGLGHFYIEQRSGMSIHQIGAAARRFVARQRAQGRTRIVLIMDYLGLIKASERYSGNRVNEVGEVTRTAKALAKELGVPIILLSQLNRKVEETDSKRPELHHLRDSGDIEQDADTVLFLFREEYYLRQKSSEELSDEDCQRLNACSGHLEIGLSKQRRGPTGWLKVFCDVSVNVVDDLYE
jgi:replicative DNA helicase